MLKKSIGNDEDKPSSPSRTSSSRKPVVNSKATRPKISPEEQSLLVAVLTNNAAAVRNYIESGGDVNLFINSRPLIMHAFKWQSSKEIIRILLSAGADTLRVYNDKLGLSIFPLVAVPEDCGILSLCIDHIVSTNNPNHIDKKTPDGMTVLCLVVSAAKEAFRKNSQQIEEKRLCINSIKALFRLYLNTTNLSIETDESAFEVIASVPELFDAFEEVKKIYGLSSKNKTVFPFYNIPSRTDIQALWIRNRASYMEALSALLRGDNHAFEECVKRGFDVNQPYSGETLYQALFFNVHDDHPTAKELLPCLEMLTSAKAELISKHSSNEVTLLHIYALDSEALLLILDFFRKAQISFDIDQLDKIGDTPLLKACRGGNYKSVALLLERGASPGYSSAYGIYPADIVDDSCPSAILSLLNEGKTKSKLEKKTASHASTNNDESLPLELNPKLPPLIKLSFILQLPKKFHKKMIDKHKLSVDEEIDGMLPLSYTALWCNTIMMVRLVELGANPFRKSSQYLYNTPLHFAANVSDSDVLYTMLAILMKNQLLHDVNIKNAEGLTPLHYVGLIGNPFTFKKFTRHFRGDPTIQDNLGRTPLDLLRESVSEEDLISYGIVDKPVSRKSSSREKRKSIGEIEESELDLEMQTPTHEKESSVNSLAGQGRLSVKDRKAISRKRYSDSDALPARLRSKPLPTPPGSQGNTPKLRRPLQKTAPKSSSILVKTAVLAETVQEAEKSTSLDQKTVTLPMILKAKDDVTQEKRQFEKEQTLQAKSSTDSKEEDEHFDDVDSISSKVDENYRAIDRLQEKTKEIMSNTSDIQELKKAVEEVQKQMRDLQDNQNYLLAERAVKIQRNKMRARFKKEPNLWEFYRCLNIKLEELFIGCKAVASGIVDHNLKEVLGKVGSGVVLLGEVLKLIPAVGNTLEGIAKGAGSVVEKVDHTRLENMLHTMSTLGTLGDIKKTCECVARHLTKRYENQLKKMRTLDEEAEALLNRRQHGNLKEKIISNLRHLVKKGNKAVLKGQIKSPIEELAEFTVLELFEAIKNDKFIPDDNLADQFIKSICYPPEERPKSKQAIRKITKKMGVFTVVTKDEKVWYLCDIFQRSGVQTTKGQYIGGKIDIKLYGFCISEIDDEVVERNLELRQSFRNSVLQKKKPSTPSLAPSTDKFVKDTIKRMEEQKKATELAQKQLANATARRQSLYGHVDNVKGKVGGLESEVGVLRKQVEQLMRAVAEKNSSDSESNESTTFENN